MRFAVFALTGIMTCTGNSITAPDVVRTFDFIDLKAIGKNRFEIVDGPSAAPPANCYGGTSKAQMMEELKFGSGSDCASTSACYDDPARGGFQIDLRETGFEIGMFLLRDTHSGGLLINSLILVFIRQNS